MERLTTGVVILGELSYSCFDVVAMVSGFGLPMLELMTFQGWLGAVHPPRCLSVSLVLLSARMGAAVYFKIPGLVMFILSLFHWFLHLSSIYLASNSVTARCTG